MTFEELKDFLENKMRMSHIYQPLLIKSLLEFGGTSTIRQMALKFLEQDESQILYYEDTLKKMPIKVLKKHEIIKQEGNLITLNVSKLTLKEKAELKMICEMKMQEYIAKRGIKIWDYRLLDSKNIPDNLRYRVLKEAKGRCELCGATKDDRPLDVDHIIPRSKGGKTVYENLQVLCSKCNRTKKNKDDTDFRKQLKGDFKEDCLFCNGIDKKHIILENGLAYAILDKYPVTYGHTLIIPKRHFADYFEITKAELNAVHDLIKIRRKQLLEEDKSIEGFNVGVNSGKVAGQTIYHCHIHLIPRRKGDVKDPTGGVRGVIPSKRIY